MKAYVGHIDRKLGTDWNTVLSGYKTEGGLIRAATRYRDAKGWNGVYVDFVREERPYAPPFLTMLLERRPT